MKNDKSISLLNKILEIINNYFKLIIIICAVVSLIIYYQSTLNHRYQLHYQGENEISIFDTKRGEVYFLVWDRKDPNQIEPYDPLGIVPKGTSKKIPGGWLRMSPFSEKEVISLE